MADWSRRDVLRAGAGVAAVAVPMVALAGTPVGASPAPGTGAGPDLGGDELAAFGDGQVMFAVRDAARGEVAIYHGRNEVVVQDRALVARIVRAANARRAG